MKLLYIKKEGGEWKILENYNKEEIFAIMFPDGIVYDKEIGIDKDAYTSEHFNDIYNSLLNTTIKRTKQISLEDSLKEAISLVKQCLEQTDEILSILKELSTPKAGVTNCEHSQELINNDIIKEGINFTWDKALSKELTDSLK